MNVLVLVLQLIVAVVVAFAVQLTVVTSPHEAWGFLAFIIAFIALRVATWWVRR